jgi:hypothetical protein
MASRANYSKWANVRKGDLPHALAVNAARELTCRASIAAPHHPRQPSPAASEYWAACFGHQMEPLVYDLDEHGFSHHFNAKRRLWIQRKLAEDCYRAVAVATTM